MSKIKICGITRECDISYVNKYLPEYIGFIFAKSRRQVSPQHVKSIEENLNKRIKKVGVFVNEDLETVVYTACKCGLDVVQIHGDETPEYILRLKREMDLQTIKKVDIWKAVRVKDKDSIKKMAEYDVVDVFVLDAFVDGSYGGAGKTFDWSLAVEANKYGKIILAGGLDIQNVRDAIRIVQPFAVDVSSGVETDGYKDETKIRDFISIARTY